MSLLQPPPPSEELRVPREELVARLHKDYSPGFQRVVLMTYDVNHAGGGNKIWRSVLLTPSLASAPEGQEPEKQEVCIIEYADGKRLGFTTNPVKKTYRIFPDQETQILWKVLKELQQHLEGDHVQRCDA